MVNKCSVPNCNGNYNNGPKVSVFSFPRDKSLRQKWISAIPRKNFKWTEHSKVCELHFTKQSIRQTTDYFDEKAGKHISINLQQPRLVKDAVPSIFQKCPKYLSSFKSHRDAPEEKRVKLEQAQIKEAIEKSLEYEREYVKKNCFSSFSELVNCLENNTIPDDWTIIYKPDFIMFLKFNFDDIPVISASVKIDSNLQLIAYTRMNVVAKLENYILPYTVRNIQEIYNILSEYNLDTCNTKHFEIHINALQNTLEILKNYLDEEKHKILAFISEQLSFINRNKHHYIYSSEFLILSSLLYSISPQSYQFLRNSGIFTLPHPHTLSRVCSSYSSSPKLEQNEKYFMAYIKQRSNFLNLCDRNVVLLMDEIHIKPFLDYKGGSILGLDYKSENAATSAIVFMIQSIISKFKDVVHILPVKSISAEALFPYVKRVIIELHKVGFNVISVITDNNAINRKAISYFATPPKLSIVYQHPYNSEQPLFFLFDTVHLMKCIRNNWLNQKNYHKCMYYPKFPLHLSSDETENSSLNKASLELLRKLHTQEEDCLVKYGYNFTLKALNPTSLERQNVKYVLQIFNNFVFEGLKLVGSANNWPDCFTTAEFISIICSWFEIMNVRTPFKGKHKLNRFQEPLTMLPDDPKIEFLTAFIDWLEIWEQVKIDTGSFSKETHLALKHTTIAMIEITRYCTEELHLQYVLTGKLQTDSLEDRFGKYRQLAGANYNISMTQLFETESKLRIRNLANQTLALKLPLTIDNTDELSRHTESCNENENQMYELDSFTVNDADIQKLENSFQVLTYIAGYCGYVAMKKLHCLHCKNNILLDKCLDINESYAFIRNLDRGNLKYPSPNTVSIIVYNYMVITKLLSDEHKLHFLNETNQRSFIIETTAKLLISNEIFFDGCPLNHSAEYINMLILRPSTNIMLRNYCRNINDKLTKNKLESNSRKLQTLKQK